MIETPPDALCARLCAGPAPWAPLSVAFIAAHPDDEAIGAGARLPRWPGARVIHVTDGAPKDMRDALARGFATRDEYARARRRELLSALALAGVGEERWTSLDVADQEASLHLPRIATELAAALRGARTDVVVTHPYEGGHPDHDATAFAVHAACALLRAQGSPAPSIVEMTSYHRRASGVELQAGEFLPAPGIQDTTVVLSSTERRLKRALFRCYRSQGDVLQAFSVAVERFRPAPEYDFTAPPHEGRLLYEDREWGMTGAQWRSLAERARRALRLGGRL